MKNRTRTAIAAGLLPVLFCGCGTTYQPAHSPRIAVTMHGGGLTLERDGQRFGIGPFSDGVVRAVQGNAAAEEQARTYQQRLRRGLALQILGLGVAIAGIAIDPDYTDAMGNVHHVDSPRGTASTVMIVGGLATIFAALPVVISGQVHLWDAVNIYNDGLTKP